MTKEIINNSAPVFFSDIGNLIANFQWKDFFDIAIIAVIAYIFIILFIRTKSIRILFGVLFLIALYGMAIFLNLPMSKMFFNSFFGMFLVILAVVFQRELRKLFELIGLLGMRKRILLTSESALRMIAETSAGFSRSKTGALIIFPGLEPIDRHIEGGVLLNGKISQPLLASIFDKNSPGHDGALIVEGDKIRKFGVHLPLAENMEIAKNHGTRHRAGLGLSERTDALCLIVSEETGKISLARAGKLFAVKNYEELEKKLENFFKEKFPAENTGKYKRLIKRNIVPIAISLGLALVFWTVFNFQSAIAQKNFLAPVEFRNLSSNMLLDNLSESEIVVTLSGRERDFKVFDEKTLKVSIDVSELKFGWHKILINKDYIKKPSEFTLVSIEPASVKFRLAENKEQGEE